MVWTIISICEDVLVVMNEDGDYEEYTFIIAIEDDDTYNAYLQHNESKAKKEIFTGSWSTLKRMVRRLIEVPTNMEAEE